MKRSEMILVSIIVAVWAVFVFSMLATEANGYDRDNWKHWIDADGDRQHARYEVLIDESITRPVIHNGKPVMGLWLCVYTAAILRDPGKLDVDHLIPLSYAAHRGGEEWSKQRKELYANDLGDPDHLVAVLAAANRAKGGKGPSEWMPPWTKSWCWYADAWERVSTRWGIKLDAADVAKIAEVRSSEGCAR
jgi:hypothetical protein